MFVTHPEQKVGKENIGFTRGGTQQR